MTTLSLASRSPLHPWVALLQAPSSPSLLQEKP